MHSEGGGDEEERKRRRRRVKEEEENIKTKAIRIASLTCIFWLLFP